jgi:hypothetical protein
MVFDEFRERLDDAQPPDGASPLLAALWWDAKGNWEKAHDIAQDVASPDGAWVHAYLHRKEGDEGNAGYWYRQAGKPRPQSDLRAEWEAIVKELLIRP